MDNLDKLILLRKIGLSSEGIGPVLEWHPVPRDEHQLRHTQFWSLITDFIEAQPEGYDDLPSWMTEDATQLLEANTNL